MIKRLIICLILILVPATCSRAELNNEVVVSVAMESKMSITVLPPTIAGLPEKTVNEEFYSFLCKDLEEAGRFEIIKGLKPVVKNVPNAKDATSINNVGLSFTTTIVKNSNDDVEIKAQVIDSTSNQNTDHKASIINKSYTGKSINLRFMAHKIADDLIFRLTGERGIANTCIFFAKETGLGIKEIYKINRDGTNVAPVTAYKSLTISPTIAIDGKIAYVTYKSGKPEIWGQRSPHAAHVRLYPLSSNSEEHCFCPSWSPDGKTLAIVQNHHGNSDIIVLDLASGHTRRLTNSGCINTDPSWNAKGTQLAFTSDRNGTPQIFLMDSDGSNVRQLTREGRYNSSPAWSPSGSMIAYVSRFEGKFNLFIYKLGECRSYQITPGVSSAESPSWSPDERCVVFTSGRMNGMQLYITDLSGNMLRKLSNLNNCQSPKWAQAFN